MKHCAPATMRNRAPILGVLRNALPRRGSVLELASGTGQHAAYFARQLPHLRWQPTDVDATALASVEAYRQQAGLDNLAPPLPLDARDADWGELGEAADAIVCINMIHIAPWAACEGLLAGAGRYLPLGAPLVLYGPFRFDGAFTAPSNARFDASLRAQNREWGVRELGDVTTRAELADLALEQTVSLPANNHAVVFRKRSVA
jgi:hypothetical protein